MISKPDWQFKMAVRAGLKVQCQLVVWSARTVGVLEGVGEGGRSEL